MSDLDAANALFVSRVRSGEIGQASLLRILIFEEQTLDERSLLEYQIREFELGGIDPSKYQIPEELLRQFPPEEYLVTWTVPIDISGRTYFLATAYYLSDIARQHWEKRVNGEVIWFLSPFSAIEGVMEGLQAKRENMLSTS